MGLNLWTMDSSAVTGTLRDPTRSLLDLYTAHNNADDFPAVVSDHFATIFRPSDAFNIIPVLNVRNPPEAYQDRTLVRFRAMVQDTSQSPEIYVSQLQDGGCGGWGLDRDVDETLLRRPDYTELRDCVVMWAVNVPGETDWVTDTLDGPSIVPAVAHHPTRPHKYPVTGAPHIGVQVKMYHSPGNDIKPTDVVTFVGILTNDLLQTESEEPLHVPTLHVLFSESTDRTPLFRHPLGDDPVRDELISWISEEALGGDSDAAEWVLLACIAKVQSRHTPLLPPSLTLSRLPVPPTPSAIPTLCHVLHSLLQTVLTLPLSVNKLNRNWFAPESIEEDLHSGFLQVPSGTTVLITETGLQEGKLLEKGVMNVTAIQNAITTQTLAYIFPYSQFSFNTDMSFVVLAEGSKSAFFKTDINVPVRPNSSANFYKDRSEVKMPSADKLTAFRQFLFSARCNTVQVGETVSEHIQNDFVLDRQRNPSVTPEEFIVRMKVAKLMALSLSATELDIDIWERTKSLNERCKTRIQ